MGIFSAISGLVGSALGSSASKRTDRASAVAAAKANEFTEKQLKNKHQWEVQDLKSAGLNPILSAHGSGAIGSSAMAKVTDKSESARNSALAAGQMANLAADTDLKASSAKNMDAKTINEAGLNPLWAATNKVGTGITKSIGDLGDFFTNKPTSAKSTKPKPNISQLLPKRQPFPKTGQSDWYKNLNYKWSK